MVENNKIAFKSMMDTLTTLYQRPHLDIDTLRIWFHKLESYEFNVVTSAFDKWVDNNKYMPTPFDIISLAKQKPIEYAKLTAPKLDARINKSYSAKVIAYLTEYYESKINEKTDGRAWAKRILANPKNYPAISVKIASEALNIK